MIIYKSHGSDRTIYDTDRPDWAEYNAARSTQLAPLQHHTSGMLVRDYLLQFYPPSHEIFNQFGEAYYYKHDTEDEYPHTNNDGICQACEMYQFDTMSFPDGLQLCPRHATERFGNRWWGGEDEPKPEYNPEDDPSHPMHY